MWLSTPIPRHALPYRRVRMNETRAPRTAAESDTSTSNFRPTVFHIFLVPVCFRPTRFEAMPGLGSKAPASSFLRSRTTAAALLLIVCASLTESGKYHTHGSSRARPHRPCSTAADCNGRRNGRKCFTITIKPVNN